MVRKYYEISCDTCNCAEHFPIGNGTVQEQAREYGWIITADGKHYDSKECYLKSKNKS
jgi:hypothetical protein